MYVYCCLALCSIVSSQSSCPITITPSTPSSFPRFPYVRFSSADAVTVTFNLQRFCQPWSHPSALARVCWCIASYRTHSIIFWMSAIMYLKWVSIPNVSSPSEVQNLLPCLRIDCLKDIIILKSSMRAFCKNGKCVPTHIFRYLHIIILDRQRWNVDGIPRHILKNIVFINQCNVDR